MGTCSIVGLPTRSSSAGRATQWVRGELLLAPITSSCACLDKSLRCQSVLFVMCLVGVVVYPSAEPSATGATLATRMSEGTFHSVFLLGHAREHWASTAARYQTLKKQYSIVETVQTVSEKQGETIPLQELPKRRKPNSVRYRQIGLFTETEVDLKKVSVWSVFVRHGKTVAGHTCCRGKKSTAPLVSCGLSPHLSTLVDHSSYFWTTIKKTSCHVLCG